MTVSRLALLVFRKELTTGLRFRAAWAAMFMFALTTLSCVSLALGGASLAPELAAALLWVLIFFASLAGSDRVFGDEESAGTLGMLRIYAPAQAVLGGKLLYTLLIMLVLTLFTSVLFILFMDVTVVAPLLFIAALVLGAGGLAAAGTLLAALTTGASVRSGLFSVLMLPVILPIMLPAIAVTTAALGAGTAGVSYLGGMALYDAVLAVGASVLFDYLWYE